MVAPPELTQLRMRIELTRDKGMTERLDEHNIAVDTQLASAGACAQIHLPSGRICMLPLRHPGSCQFVSLSNIADTEKVPRQRART